jgi:2-oxoglutarate ferredoxin oxidoreductase subunit gamma
VISDRPVGSPVIRSPRAVLAMNLPSLDKFERDVRPGGLLLINSSLISRDPARADLTVVKVPANEIANSLGNPRAANMVALGAYLGATGAVSVGEVETMIRESLLGSRSSSSSTCSLHRGVEVGAAAVGRAVEAVVEEGS